MCGRTATPEAELDRFEAELRARWRIARPPARYNLGPGDYLPVVLLEDGSWVLDCFRWGLIPGWAKDPSIASATFNARGETVQEKPAFRSAFRRQRCLIPVPGFYEWQRIPGRRTKQPWWIHPADRSVMTFAGLWELWRPAPDAEPVYSCSIVTTEPNEFMAPLHHRMPVILEGDERDRWLDPATRQEELRDLIRPARADYLTGYRVGTGVNIPTLDAPELLEPLDADGVLLEE